MVSTLQDHPPPQDGGTLKVIELVFYANENLSRKREAIHRGSIGLTSFEPGRTNPCDSTGHRPSSLASKDQAHRLHSVSAMTAGTGTGSWLWWPRGTAAAFSQSGARSHADLSASRRAEVPGFQLTYAWHPRVCPARDWLNSPLVLPKPSPRAFLSEMGHLAFGVPLLPSDSPAEVLPGSTRNPAASAIHCIPNTALRRRAPGAPASAPSVQAHSHRFCGLHALTSDKTHGNPRGQQEKRCYFAIASCPTEH